MMQAQMHMVNHFCGQMAGHVNKLTKKKGETSEASGSSSNDDASKMKSNGAGNKQKLA